MDRQKDWYDYYARWCELCAQWEKIFFNGSDARRLTDGQRLNGIRNAMKWCIADMEADGFSLEGILKDADANHYTTEKTRRGLPPKMPDQWMKEGEEKIRKNAKVALGIYQEFGDYVYIKEYLPQLGQSRDVAIVRKIEKLTECVWRLELAIKYGRMAEMREYSNLDKYLSKIEYAKELLMMRMEYLQPFS